MKHQDIHRKCLHRRSISSTKRTKEINTAIVADTVKYTKKRHIYTQQPTVQDEFGTTNNKQARHEKKNNTG